MPGMENPNWLVGIRVYRTSQVVCPSTVIYLTKLYKKLLAILLFAYGTVKRQQGVGLAAGRSSKISVNCGQSINGYDEVYDIRMNECIV